MPRNGLRLAVSGQPQKQPPSMVRYADLPQPDQGAPLPPTQRFLKMYRRLYSLRRSWPLETSNVTSALARSARSPSIFERPNPPQTGQSTVHFSFNFGIATSRKRTLSSAGDSRRFA